MAKAKKEETDLDLTPHRMTFTMAGKTPLMLHNGRGADPESPLSMRVSALTKAMQRKGVDKTSLAAERRRAEWENGMCFDEALGPIIPPWYVRKMVLEAAKSSREGKAAERGVLADLAAFPILYKGPRDLDAMWAEGIFADTRPARIPSTKGVVMRTRPIFHVWSCRASVLYVAGYIGHERMQTFLRLAGALEGVGDGRSLGFGRFTVGNVEDEQLEL